MRVASSNNAPPTSPSQREREVFYHLSGLRKIDASFENRLQASQEEADVPRCSA